MRTIVIGQRVQLHPRTFEWAQGDRYGAVLAVGSHAVRLMLDSGRVKWFFLADILAMY